MAVCINLVVNSVLILCQKLLIFDSGLSQGDFVTSSVDFVLPQSSVLKNNNNYRTAHSYIRPQSDDEQGINKLWPQVEISKNS